jgi:putative membrane protein
MGRFLVRLVIHAVALWVTTLLVSGVTVKPYEAHSTVALVLTYLLVAFVFGLVNGILGTIIRVVAFPLYILTLGLLALIVNALLLILVAHLTQLFGFGLTVAGFWSGVWGALVLAILTWLISLILRPLLRKRDA